MFCVDRDGLVLEERTVDGGKVVRRPTARYVRVDVDVDAVEVRRDRRRRHPRHRQGGGSVQRVTDDSRTPGDFWELGSTPSGFTHRGRYAVVPPPRAAFRRRARGRQRAAGVVDVYVRGADVVTVDRGGSSTAAAACNRCAGADVPSTSARSVGPS